MPPYDDRLFAPPAAVLNARLRNHGAIIPDVLLLIDTGADVTLLPLRVVNAAGIEQTGASYELLAFDGRSSAVGAVRADLLMLGRAFRGQFLVIDQQVGILGRNILNALALVPRARARAVSALDSPGERLRPDPRQPRDR